MQISSDLRKDQVLAFLQNLWRYVVPPGPDGNWLFLGSRGDVSLMRDGGAHGLACRRLAERRDIDFRFWRVQVPVASQPLPWRKFVAIGRFKALFPTSIGWLARPFERATWGKYQDPDNGLSGDSIRYGNRIFSRRQIGVTASNQRVFDVDYGLLVFHRVTLGDVDYVYAQVCGLGGLGTDVMMKIACDPVLAGELREKAEALVGDTNGCDPELGFEVVTRISVPDPDDVLNLIQVPAEHGSTEGRGFSFDVEAVALAKREGGHSLWMSEASTHRRLRLEPNGRGGWASLDPGWKRELSDMCFALVTLLNGIESGVAAKELRARLGYPESTRSKATFRQLVRATNKALADKDSPELVRAWIRAHGKAGPYILHVRSPGV